MTTEVVKVKKKNYFIIAVIALLNCLPGWGLILGLMIPLGPISFVFFILPFIVAIVIIKYSFVGIKEWDWKKNFHSYEPIIVSIIAIAIHIFTFIILAYSLAGIP